LNPDSLLKAKRYAFLLLKFRLRSKAEMAVRLKRKGFEQEVIDKTIAFLVEKSFLDDQQFARELIDSRLRKSLGLRRIKRELIDKGIKTDIIDNQISTVERNYSEEEVISSVIESRAQVLAGLDKQKARQRLYGYLMRRGFSQDIVIEVIEKKISQL
jgi:regulatory protein